MAYEKQTPSYSRDPRTSLMVIFDDLHRKWLNGMDITSYSKAEKKRDEIIVRMDTFFDDDLVKISEKLLETGKTTPEACVLWLSCCKFKDFGKTASVIARSLFYSDGAERMFKQQLEQLLGKPVSFTHSPEIKAMVMSV